jgi:hypothetical protein
MFDKPPIKFTKEDERELTDQNDACLAKYYEQWLIRTTLQRVDHEIAWLQNEAKILSAFGKFISDYIHILHEGGARPQWFILMKGSLETIETLRKTEGVPPEVVREVAISIAERFVKNARELLS